MLRQRRDRLHEMLAAQVPDLALNGHPNERLPNTLNVSFPGVAGSALPARVSEVAASTGSACHAEDQAPSGVLGAMGLSLERARGAVRLSVGVMTADKDVLRAAASLCAAYQAIQ